MEHVMYQFWINRPNDVEIAIFQSNFNQKPRIQDEEVTSLFEGCDIRTFRGYFNKFTFLENSDTPKVLTEVLIIPLLAHILKYTLLKKLRNELSKFDVIYFFNSNREPRLLRGKKQMQIGSAHAWFPSNSSLFKRIELRLVEYGLIMHNLNYFHLFPAQFNLLETKREEKFFSIPNGVESRKFVPGEIRENAPIKFLFNARLEECKGILLVIRAFRTLKSNEHVELHIVGSGELSSYIKLETDKRIYLHGFVSEEELQRIISSCDILVYPSKCDSFSLVVLNSLSCGLHVITTMEISKNFLPLKEEGFLTITNLDPDSIANAMLESMKNINTIRMNKSQCHNLVAERYDWKQITKELYEKIRELYKTYIDEHRGREVC